MSHSHESHNHQDMHAHREHACCARKERLADRLRQSWLCWLLPIVGLFSLAWFLLRVIPKPSRATYPCQRVAMPLASGFVAWLIGLVGTVVAFRKAKGLLRQSRLPLAIACLVGHSCLALWQLQICPRRR